MSHVTRLTLATLLCLAVAACSGASPEGVFEDGSSSPAGGGSSGDGGASATGGAGTSTGTTGATGSSGPGATGTSGPGAGPGATSTTVTGSGPGGAACGDLVCDATESCSTCPADCACSATCGDGVCAAPETCQVCPGDCGACSAVCGDGVCEASELQTCPVDCGGGPGATTSTGGGGVCPPDPCEAGGSVDALCPDTCVLFVCILDPSCCGPTWTANCAANALALCDECL